MYPAFGMPYLSTIINPTVYTFAESTCTVELNVSHEPVIHAVLISRSPSYTFVLTGKTKCFPSTKAMLMMMKCNAPLNLPVCLAIVPRRGTPKPSRENCKPMEVDAHTPKAHSPEAKGNLPLARQTNTNNCTEALHWILEQGRYWGLEVGRTHQASPGDWDWAGRGREGGSARGNRTSELAILTSVRSSTRGHRRHRPWRQACAWKEKKNTLFYTTYD